jgi:hypothetical protein
MSRDVCGICWCPYGDDGKCACDPAPLIQEHKGASDALLLECVGLLMQMPVKHPQQSEYRDELIQKMREHMLS